MTHLQEQILKIIIYQPTQLRTLLATCNNIGYVIRYLNDLLPYRFGVEIDCAGGSHEIISRFQYLGSSTGKFESNSSFDFHSDTREKLNYSSELRFSTWSIKGLRYFKSLLEEYSSNKDCSPSNTGGLHIHIDLGHDSMRRKWLKLHYKSSEESYARKIAKDKIEPYFRYIRNKVFGHTGEYQRGNTKVSQGGGGGAISVMRHLPTVEYRLGKPTFSYSTIMKQVLCLELMHKSIRLNQPFNKVLADKILVL